MSMRATYRTGWCTPLEGDDGLCGGWWAHDGTSICRYAEDGVDLWNVRRPMFNGSCVMCMEMHPGNPGEPSGVWIWREYVEFLVGAHEVLFGAGTPVSRDVLDLVWEYFTEYSNHEYMDENIATLSHHPSDEAPSPGGTREPGE